MCRTEAEHVLAKLDEDSATGPDLLPTKILKRMAKARAERLVHKLRAKQIPEAIVALISSWLRGRTAHVVVGGQKSAAMHLIN